MAEKRRAHRILVRFPVQYHSQTARFSGWASDLSQDGVFVRSDFLDATGAPVALALQLPGNEAPLRLRGQVVRVDETPETSGMGIRFTEVSPGDRLSLANYMIRSSCATTANA
jgi:uncharacterized protein (TIGR02266 family)